MIIFAGHLDITVGRSRSAAGANYHVVYLSKHSIPGAYNQTGVYYEQERETTIWRVVRATPETP
jgi:protoheme ferro-lyase